MKKKNLIGVISGLSVLSLALAGCGSSGGSSNTTTTGSNNSSTASSNSSSTTNTKNMPKSLTIASQSYSEATIDDYIVAELIEAKTPIKVTVKTTSGASQLMHSMMQQNNIQIYVGYDGTEFQEQLKQSYTGKYVGHPKLVYNYVKQQEMKQFGVWVSPSLGYQDTYALAVNKDVAQKYNLKTDSQAAKYASNWVLATDTTFPNLAHTGLKDFDKTYNIHFKSVKPMSYDLIYEALHKGAVQAIMAYSTDGRLQKLNEVPLTDDKNFFPPYHGLVLIKDKVRQEANLDQILAPLWGNISTAEQTKMNYDVDVLKQDPSKVAHDFLVQKGLISK